MIGKAVDQFQRSLDEAIAWHVRITSPDADELAWTEFVSWLEADSANRIAFDHVEDLHSELTTLASSLVPKAAQAKAKTSSEYLSDAWVRFWTLRSAWVTVGVALAASIILVLVYLTANPEPMEYATHIGETRTVILADGTKIDLNTATKILTVKGSDRHVALEQGEALFHVARDPARSFIVTVGDRDVRDVGTAFNVLRNEGIITVVVAEGKVAVSPRDDVKEVDEVRLVQGDQLVRSEDNGATTVEHVDIARALAWRQGYLIYDKAPLSKVVSDLNRYFPSHISIENNEVASDRFSGVLRVDNEDAVLHRLSQFLAVRAHHQADGSIVLRRPRNSD